MNQLLLTSIQIFVMSIFYVLPNLSNRTKSICFFVFLLESFSLFIFYSGLSKFYTFTLLFLSFFFLIKLNWKNINTNININYNFNIGKTFQSYTLFIGIFIIILPFLLEYLLFDGLISVNGKLVIITGLSWCFFGYVPSKYTAERDFLFLFINSFTFLFIFPILIYKLINYDIEDLPYFWVVSTKTLLVSPLEKMLLFFGFNVWSIENSLYYEDLDASKVNSVVVAVECSGLYSTIIFTSAFFSYVIQKNFPYQLSLPLFGIGLILCYLSNLFRMFIIIVVGHYYGAKALEWVHLNLGWLIFTFFILFFWFMIIDPWQRKIGLPE